MFSLKRNPAEPKSNYFTFRSIFTTFIILKVFLLILIFTGPKTASSQSLQWKELSGFPTFGGFQDIYFLNTNTGWALGNSKVLKTTNSGISWTPYDIQYTSRSIGFFDSLTGVIGNFGAPSAVTRTTDGGESWTPVENIGDLQLTGICGISIVNENIAYACGAYHNVGKVCKTTNKGLSWSLVFNDTSMARTLVDCYFWSADSGIAAGGYNISSFHSGNSVVILTTNGGATWSRVYKSTRSNEWCWKISFNPAKSRTFGVISLQRLNGELSYYLKTTNQGFSWSEIPFMVYSEQGIGFLNENTGWIAGGNSTVGDTSLQTTNGGLNWATVKALMAINRMRFINDTLAFAAGRTISKYTREVVGISHINLEIPNNFNLYQNYPNPFNPRTIIKFDLTQNPGSEKQLVKLTVFDAIGRIIKVIVHENLSPGSYSEGFDGGYYPSGIYYYKLEAGSGLNRIVQTRKMLILK